MSQIPNRTSKTRIAYVNHTGLISGAEKVLMSILHGVDRTCSEPILVCPPDGCLAEVAESEEIPWIPIRPIRARFSWSPKRLCTSLVNLCKGVLDLRKALQTISPDLIHANSVRAGITASLATLGSGQIVIWHVHDSLPRHPVSTLIRLFAYLDRRTRVIAVSHATARRFCGYFSIKGRVRTIYNGINLSRFPGKQRGPSRFRETLNVANDDFLVCAIGQICARKGLLELIEAFRQIHVTISRMHLAIVGSVVFQHEEKYRDKIYAAAGVPELNGFVHFVGEMKDVYPALEASDLLVLNSREEPFGLVLVEAMSSGTPVLATRVGGVPEIVEDGKNGWLVESGDTRALAAKLIELSGDCAGLERAAHYAQTVTCPQFSMERFQGSLRGLYGELAPKSDQKWNPATNRHVLSA